MEASLGLLVSAGMLLIHSGVFLASANLIPEASFSDKIPFVVIGFVFVGLAIGNLIFGLLLRSRINAVRPLGFLTGLASMILFFGLLALTVIGTVMQLAAGERGFIVSGLVGLVFQVLGFAFSIKAVRWMFSDPANRFFRELAGR